VFTARYALSPYIKQIRFVFRGLIIRYILSRVLRLFPCAYVAWKHNTAFCRLCTSSVSASHGAEGALCATQFPRYTQIWTTLLNFCRRASRVYDDRFSASHVFLLSLDKASIDCPRAFGSQQIWTVFFCRRQGIGSYCMKVQFWAVQPIKQWSADLHLLVCYAMPVDG
jgi:hypothetical protein